MQKKFHKQYLLIALIILGFRITIFQLSDNTMTWHELETYGRLKDTLFWLKTGDFIYPNIYFSPIYSYIIAFSWKLYNTNLEIAPRIISTLFSFLILIPMYCIAKKLFSKKIGIYACIILIIHPLISRCSVVSLPAIIFSFFILTALFFLTKYIEKPFIYFLLISIFSFNIAIGLRFEGVIYVPVAAAFLFLKNKQKTTIIFSVLSLLLFFIHLCISYLKENNFFATFIHQEQNSYIEMQLYAISYRFSMCLKYFIRTITYPGFFFSCLGIANCLYKKKNLFFLFFFLAHFVLLLFKTLMGTIPIQNTRYFCLLIILVSPYMAIGIEQLVTLSKNIIIYFFLSKKHNKTLKTFIQITLILSLSIFFILQTFIDIKKNQILPETKDLIKWLPNIIQTNHSIIMDKVQQHYILLNFHKKSQQFIQPVFLKNDTSGLHFDSNGNVNEDHLFQTIEDNANCYILYAKLPGTGFKKLFTNFNTTNNKTILTKDIGHTRYTFIEIYKNQHWIIYKTEHTLIT